MHLQCPTVSGNKISLTVSKISQIIIHKLLSDHADTDKANKNDDTTSFTNNKKIILKKQTMLLIVAFNEHVRQYERPDTNNAQCNSNKVWPPISHS